MAKSSMHIDSAKINFLAHNTRRSKTVNSIFDDEENYYSCDFDTAVKLYREELAKRSAKYTERTGQKLQAKTITMLSAVVNLNQHHTEHDLQKIVDHLEQTLDTKVINFAIHRDEGHIDKNGKAVKNYHAHVVFMGLDSEGRSVRKKLTKGYLSELQDKTAQLLRMERGTNYAKERKPRPKRLDTYEFKAAKEREEKAVDAVVQRSAKLIVEEIDTRKAKIKDLQAENKRLRAELKEAGASRAEYRELESLVADLRSKIKNKDLMIRDMIDAMDRQKNAILSLKSQNESLKSQNQALAQPKEEKGLKIANLEHLSSTAKKEVEKIAQNAVTTELIAAALRNEKGAGRVHHGVLHAGIDYEIAAEADIFSEKPNSKNEEDLRIVKKAFPDAEPFYAVSFATHVFLKTAKENILDALNQTNDFLKQFIAKMQEIRKEIEEEQEIEEAYDHSQDRGNYNYMEL